jgi:hypothetical protein
MDTNPTPESREPADFLAANLNGVSGPTDAWDLDKLRLPQDYSAAIASRKLVATVPVRKPKRTEFIQCQPNPDWHYKTMLFPDPETGDFYLIAPDLWEEYAGHAHPCLLVPALTRHKTLFIWPLRLPGLDGRRNSWHDSALEAAELAQRRWLRLEPNQELGAYDMIVAAAQLSEPDWSILDDLTLERLLQIAFKRRLINSFDHDLLQRLRGEV